MIITAASDGPAADALARKSSTSISPSAVALTATTRMPAICAEAGLVPWAEVGMRHTSRASPRERW